MLDSGLMEKGFLYGFEDVQAGASQECKRELRVGGESSVLYITTVMRPSIFFLKTV